MQILHVIASMNPVQGGPPVVARNLADSQAALGHRVSIVSHLDSTQVLSKKERFFTDGFSATDPTPSIIGVPQLDITSLIWSRGTDFRNVVSTASVIHIHGIWEPLLPVVARIARKLGRPYVVTPHGMLDPWSLSQKKWKKKLALALGYRKMLNRASGIHVLNADEQKLLAPLDLHAPCEVIPNGIFLRELEPPPDPNLFRSQQPGLGCRPYILFLSRLHFKKGLDLLAEAFASIAKLFPDVDLVVAGPDGGEEQPFRQRIVSLGLTSRTWLTGPLYGPEKWSAFAGAIAFCLPSRQEGFSIAILEALACRVPVVISENCHFPEVQEVGAGRVVPLDATAVADALAAILVDPTGAKSMGEAGRLLVEQRFTWPKVAAQTLNLYERLLKRPPAR